ncbi:MAG: BlaI/MecI/CopY family transcriptional regulator [Oscillospiraceae bacterium]|nr:BlaI/MecI/CopY family transcriptional regulator [Oscillospiraceae bacterium]MCL2280152.1 BlaI/MecI/CopY family transcriptional regulator [Oscillospiraceae bacterium]
MMDLSKNELQIMTVFWDADRPLTGAEIIKASEGKEWKERSLHSILNNLIDKGAIKWQSSIRDGRALSRAYVPLISFMDYHEDIFAKFAPVELMQTVSAAIQKRQSYDAKTVDALDNIMRNLVESLRERDTE